MADELGAGPAAPDPSIGGNPSIAGPEHACPWCSADLGASQPDRCPACGAHLTEDPNASIPGVTTVDPAAVRRAAAWSPAPKRRFLGFLTDPEPVPESGVRPSSAEALAPPSPEVRLEMARLRAELDAAAAAEAEQLSAANAADVAAAAVEDQDRAAAAVETAAMQEPGQTRS